MTFYFVVVQGPGRSRVGAFLCDLPAAQEYAAANAGKIYTVQGEALPL